MNQRIACVKRIFRWAVGEERVPATVLYALSAVESLRRGRSGARETKAVRPVPDEHVQAVLPFLPPTVRAMVEVQRLTGMRSGELCRMRTCDIEMTGNVWLYRPGTHKTAYRGHERVVRIGPQGQAVLTPFLNEKAPEAFVFSPARAQEERRVIQARGGATRRGGVTRPRRRNAQRVGHFYKPRSYRRALRYAMTAAIRAGALSQENVWHPHQLRHRHATEIRQARGLEAARVLLGHRTLSQTLEYAQADAELAASLALELG